MDPKKSPSQLRGSNTVKVTKEGAVFCSYQDGKILLLTPESSVQAQKLIGANIIVPLDELEARNLQEHLKEVQQQAVEAVSEAATRVIPHSLLFEVPAGLVERIVEHLHEEQLKEDEATACHEEQLKEDKTHSMGRSVNIV